MRNRVRRILIVAGLCALVVFLIDAPTVLWVGRTDLTVEFVVTDAATGQPIEGADVSIHSYGGFYAERGEMDLLLKADSRGAARYVCRDNMCCGAESTLRFTDTFSAHLPEWSAVVKARGYVSTEPFWLSDHPARTAVKRIAPRQSKIVIPVALRKSP